ncbi:molybdate ABC transporter substrate-binding protein [Aeromicrobium chenweiae]|uniref:Molybdate ABC transporter substrate-binding protein n=1 Tax=Aeromicrobium chenweiae TaxID=2079793 RepID=A0A2S0WP43_9ACTN|nr:molybdate ABC transporter substrate-binding protein [Aeromicrobium chenweiae]AWB93087.1 molybdate ABC transporter substrate-binding protein [Aeromicrobium chenweiae]TGN34075.1 molybdate ABC transporter substrate-binding protein [Aeromicrobium chenweiae]
MRWLLAAGLLLTSLTACGSSTADDDGDGRALTVYAAASLKTSFTELGHRFEDAHPGTTVSFSFAGSSDLVAQLQQGGPADVLATADTANMSTAADDGLVDGDPVGFAANTLEIVTPRGNPAGVDSIDDLADPDLQVVLCAPAVPCGAAARDVEKAAGVDVSPVSEEQSVTDVLNKVATGEADAGLVYVTDVRAAGDSVVGVPFAESATVVNSYPIAALAASRDTDLARTFVDFVTGPTGRAVLDDAGFARP